MSTDISAIQLRKEKKIDDIDVEPAKEEVEPRRPSSPLE
jgi:hypothetical protein